MNTAEVAGRRLVFSGGGYFRLLPLPLLQSLWRRSDYTMTYFHPRDFEPEQAILRGLGPVRRFKSYYGLGKAEAKLRSILRQFSFESVGQAERKVDWDQVPVVQID
jgi:peptidoglycan-N-acetylglucosamine deacetylase